MILNVVHIYTSQLYIHKKKKRCIKYRRSLNCLQKNCPSKFLRRSDYLYVWDIYVSCIMFEDGSRLRWISILLLFRKLLNHSSYGTHINSISQHLYWHLETSISNLETPFETNKNSFKNRKISFWGI